MKPNLTEMEERILKYIVEVIRTEGFSPSVRDIQTALEIKSTSTVFSYVARLKEKGYIQKENGKSRTLRVNEALSPAPAEERRTVRIPLVGKVAAGTPILAAENLEGYLDYPMMNRSYAESQLFALRVKGTSMIGAGIMDGDIIIVRKESSAVNGQIVVALIDDEATVKTFYKEDGHFRLQPENPDLSPIIVDDVIILGRVVSSIRFYK